MRWTTEEWVRLRAMAKHLKVAPTLAARVLAVAALDALAVESIERVRDELASDRPSRKRPPAPKPLVDVLVAKAKMLEPTAQRVIRMGRVTVDGFPVTDPAALVESGQIVKVQGTEERVAQARGAQADALARQAKLNKAKG